MHFLKMLKIRDNEKINKIKNLKEKTMHSSVRSPNYMPNAPFQEMLQIILLLIQLTNLHEIILLFIHYTQENDIPG